MRRRKPNKTTPCRPYETNLFYANFCVRGSAFGNLCVGADKRTRIERRAAVRGKSVRRSGSYSHTARTGGFRVWRVHAETDAGHFDV